VRAAAKRRRALRGAAVSAVSTVVVLGTLVTVIVTSSGWPKVRASFFDWGDFRKAFPDVLDGFWLDVRLFVILEIVVLVLGLLIAVTRTTRAPALYPLRLLSAVFTDVMRGTPTFLLVYLFGFGIPTLELSGVPTDVTILGGAALALSYSAYVAEVYRAGIESVHPSQFSGALALGLTRPQALRHVILPQAVRRVIPPLLNDFISLQKDVALVAVLGVVEAVRVAQIAASSQFIYTPLMAAGLLYLCVTIPMVRITDHVQARARRARGQVVV
jgi:polar amino acid transport system permease protein